MTKKKKAKFEKELINVAMGISGKKTAVKALQACLTDEVMAKLFKAEFTRFKLRAGRKNKREEGYNWTTRKALNFQDKYGVPDHLW